MFQSRISNGIFFIWIVRILRRRPNLKKNESTYFNKILLKSLKSNLLFNVPTKIYKNKVDNLTITINKNFVQVVNIKLVLFYFYCIQCSKDKRIKRLKELVFKFLIQPEPNWTRSTDRYQKHAQPEYKIFIKLNYSSFHNAKQHRN